MAVNEAAIMQGTTRIFVMRRFACAPAWLRDLTGMSQADRDRLTVAHPYRSEARQPMKARSGAACTPHIAA